jgi:sugar phosphate permease
MSPAAHDRPATLKSWQQRILASAWITYFAYYLCRLNMPVAGTALRGEFAWSAQDFGIVLSALTLMYAVGQFINGQLADRFGSRAVVTIGVFGSVAMNLAVLALMLGVSRGANASTVLFCLTLLWGANGFFQAMGWAPIVQMMAHWYRAEHRGKVMGFLGMSYQVGGAFASLLALFLTGYYATTLGGDWRVAFLVPAVALAIVGVFFYALARNRPEDVGLPPVNPDEIALPGGHGRAATIRGNVWRTLTNSNLWIVAGSFLLLDFNRYGFANWLPTFLQEQDIGHASPLMKEFQLIAKVCILPLGGSAGAFVAGWATDRFFGSRRAPVIAILLTALGVLSIAFPFLPAQNSSVVIAVVALIGFCTYGPHILMVGHAAQDFGKKSGAAGAAGFIDAMGYLGATAAGWGAGALINARGYRVAFIVFGVAAILGALLACVLWKVAPVTRSISPTSRT